MSATLGIACAVGSAIFNGSFAALFKTKKMVDLSIHPMVFQLYVCAGVFLSSWLVLPLLSMNPDITHSSQVGTEFRFSPLGLIGGFLLVLALSASFSAVECIGVALSQGIWGGGAMVVSYLWGVVAFGEIPVRLALSILGLFILIVGVFGIVFSDKIGKTLSSNHDEDRDEAVPLTSSGNSRSETSHQHTRGIFYACSVGIFGGSILAPLHFVPPSQQGLVFLPSFGIGALMLSPILFYAHSVYCGEMPALHIREALSTGLLSGLIWNIGNLLSIIAIPAVGYGVAYPIYQCAILFSGAIGIYVFNEILLRETIITFWMAGALLILGGTILASAQS